MHATENTDKNKYDSGPEIYYYSQTRFIFRNWSEFSF